MKEITHMNTNTMELNMNEMATVNGGDLIDSLSRIGRSHDHYARGKRKGKKIETYSNTHLHGYRFYQGNKQVD